MQTLCDNINLLGAYCGVRDIAALTPACLQAKLGVPRADAMVLFGGSILAGGDLLARAMKEKVADKYIIVGGECIVALLFAAIRCDRFCEGAFLNFLDNGAVVRWLKRLVALDAK